MFIDKLKPLEENVALAGPSPDAVLIDGTKFDKDIIRSGVYLHPTTGRPLDVTTDRMDLWVAAFDQMSKNGVKVEAVTDHDGGADAIVGYIDSIRRVGDKLMAIHNMTGPRGEKLAQESTNVSVMIEHDFKDGDGTAYGEAITHVAVVQGPVVNGQEAFIPMSRNGGTEKVPILRLQTQGENVDKLLEQMRTALGAGDDLTVENMAERISDRLGKAQNDKEGVDKEIVRLNAEIRKLKDTAIAASAKCAPAPAAATVDPHVIELTAESAEDKIDDLEKAANITPAVAASLKASLIGAVGARNSTALSVGKSGGLGDTLARQVIDALKDNDPVKLGEQTAAQTTALYRVTPGGETTLSAEQKTDLQDKMVQMVPGNNGKK